MRKKLFEFIEVSDGEDGASTAYDLAMISVILISLIPLAFKSSTSILACIENIAVSIFVVDYVLRIITADYRLGRGALSFLIYPFTFLAIVDLLTILPSFFCISPSFKMLKLLRLFRTLRVVRALKMLRYSKNIDIILRVFSKQRSSLITVGTFAVGYILVSSLIVFNLEPETFGTFFDAIYWATVSLTTVGYGDIYPVTTIGRCVTMASSFIGIAIVALPAGIITAGYMDELEKK